MSAETVVRTGDTVSITNEQQVANDFYAAASTIVQSGLVAGDVYGVGGSATINGTVESDVTAVAGRADISGAVGDDVRLIVGEATISGAVGGDVFVIGGSLHILSTAEVAGDVYLFGGEATLEGAVGGSVRGRAERIRIDAPVGGDIDVTARQGLILGARADVTGNVLMSSSRPLVRAPEAIIGGDVVSKELSSSEPTTSVSGLLLPTLVMLFGSLILYLLGGRFMAAVVSTAVARPARSLAIGLALVVAGPIVAIALLATVLGLVIGLGALGLYIVVVALSYSVAPMVLGVVLWPLLGGKRELQPFAILLGVISLQVLLLIPYVGGLAVLGLSIMAAGALADTIMQRLTAR